LAQAAADVRLDLYRASLRFLLRTVSGKGGGEAELSALLRDHGRAPVESYNTATPGRMITTPEQPFPLASGWKWTTLGSVCTHIVDCVNDTPDFSEERTPYIGLKTTNIRQNRLVLDRAWFLREDDFFRWSRRQRLQPRDVVLTREAPMGMVCQVPEQGDFALTQRMMMLRTNPNFVLPEFLKHVLNDAMLMEQANRRSRSTPPHMRVGDVPSLAVPLTDIETQRRFVKAADRCWETASKVQHERADLAASLSRLEQSVLAAAFSGRL
jgi:type I restriction enzyme S subunit